MNRADSQPAVRFDQWLLDALPVPAYLLQASDFRLVACNRHFTRRFTHDEPFNSTKLFDALTATLAAELSRAHVQVVRTGAPVSLELLDVDLGGARVCLEAHITPLAFGPLAIHAVTLLDTTDRAATERRAKEMERSLHDERLAAVALEASFAAGRQAAAHEEAQRHAAETEAVLAAISDPILIFGPDARVTRTNPAARHVLGFDPVGWDCEAISERLNIRNPDGTLPVPEALPSHRALSGETANGRYTATAENGERFIFHADAAPLQMQNGPRRALVVWRDVSDRERLIEELAASNDALADADRRKDEFLAMLGHELRNPLGAISNAARLIRLRVSRGWSVERALEILERQIQNGSRLIDDLLDVSRITRGAVQLERKMVRLDVVVANAVEAQRTMIDAARHQIAVTLPQQPVYAEGDPTRLEQIVSNLLNNAAKYTAEGGKINVDLECKDNQAEIRVRDTGIGIPPDLLPRIFDLFVQGDTTLARSKGGLGLGLTVVRRLVEIQGGTVEARSEGWGRGSEFVVSLPAARCERAEQAAREKTRPGPGARILVVEDNVDAAETLAEWLRMSGHDVTVAHDGHAALREAPALSPDVVLLDIGLPGIDGYEVARRLRGALPRRDPVIIGLTGYGQEEDRQRSVDAGFAYHLTKPVAPETLDRILAGIRAEGSPGAEAAVQP